MKKEKEGLLNKIVEYNKQIINKNGGDLNKSIKNVVLLNYKGHSIWNPFRDETLRKKVDPIEKYGEDKIERFIKNYKEKGLE